MVLLLALACGPKKNKPGELPDPADLMDRSEAAIQVGPDKSHQTRWMQGTFSLPRQGVQGPVDFRQVAPNSTQMIMDFPGIGRFEEGFDGEVAWELNPVQGPRIKAEDEVARAAFDGAFEGDEEWRERYQDLRTMGVEECDGHAVYEVKAQTVHGDARTFFLDVDTYLPVCLESEVKGAFGRVMANSILRDWRDVDGMLWPFNVTQEAMMMEMVLEWDSIEHDAPDFPGIARPSEIEALLAE